MAARARGRRSFDVVVASDGSAPARAAVVTAAGFAPSGLPRLEVRTVGEVTLAISMSRAARPAHGPIFRLRLICGKSNIEMDDVFPRTCESYAPSSSPKRAKHTTPRSQCTTIKPSFR